MTSIQIVIKNFKNKTILVVEDEDFSYLFIYSALIDYKVNVIRAKNGREAVEICQENPKIDLVLMDIQLPEMNGWDATIQILKFNENLPIIAQTAYAMNKQRDRCFEAGCIDYISKPYDNVELIKLVNQHIH
ncbi:MAG: response regulator [Bacteroidota bacterium]